MVLTAPNTSACAGHNELKNLVWITDMNQKFYPFGLLKISFIVKPLVKQIKTFI